jgi:hypothetical protein
MLALCLPAPLAAQGRGLDGGAMAYFVSLGSASEKSYQTGTWFGVEGRYASRRLSFLLRGLRGTLAGDPTREDRDARQTDLALGWRATPWLQLSVQGEAIATSTSLANTVWRMYGLGSGVRVPIGTPRLSGWAELVVYPLTAVEASQPLGTPLRAEVGLAYHPPVMPFEVRFSYLLQSIDLSGALDQRLGGLLLGVRTAGR